jgi:hypothetical protein
MQAIVPRQELNGSGPVWATEGSWDGMALWEALRGSENVLAAPSAGSFPKEMLEFLRDRETRWTYDNDEAGASGMRRVSEFVSGVVSRSRYLHWPPGLPDGYDVRDHYRQHGREALLRFLHEHLKDTPPGVAILAAPGPITDVTPLDHKDVIRRYRKWLHMPNTNILSVMFGTIYANRLGADPIWMFIVGPPGSCKTEILMTLSGAEGIITATSLTPPSLISGQQGRDPSLIPKLHKKVLIVKDFTTILSMNQFDREEIFGILRDAYDGKTEKQFGNGVHRKYVSRFGIIAAVTPVIEHHSTSHSVLGERFIKFRIRTPGKIDVGGEDITRALQNVTKELQMREELATTATRALARKVTEAPAMPPEVRNRLRYIAQVVAVMRGVVNRERYTNAINFKPSPEIGTRLAKQFCALAFGVAVYHGTPVDDETMRVVIHVAKDTAPIRIEEIIQCMYLHAKDKYVTTRQVSYWTRLPTVTVSILLEDLDMLYLIKRNPNARGEWILGPAVTVLLEKSGMYEAEERQKKGLRA